MKQRILALVTLWFICIPCCSISAAGTGTNTTIVLQATVQYMVGTKTLSQSSNPLSAVVAEVLDINTTWQDAAAVTVAPGENDRVLTFSLTNTGNGTESFRISSFSNLAGDNFDPMLVGIFLDSDADSLYEASRDPVYLPGINDPELPADGRISVFLVHRMPPGIIEGDRGDCLLRASAVTGSGTPGAVISSGGDGGIDAVVGLSGAQGSSVGTYAASDVMITLFQSATVADPGSGDQPSVGAVITYRIDIAALGSGIARGVVFSDPIPVGTVYVPNTLSINFTPLTDDLDADSGDVNRSAADTISVGPGHMASGGTAQTITFAVTIN
jgi:uncharacterized repeat protein (TIGR01451 family)